MATWRIVLGLACPLVMGPLSVGAAAAETAQVIGRATFVAGPVTVGGASDVPRPLRVGDPLHWGDVVEARKDAMARVLLGGATTVMVRELSRLALREEAVATGMRYVVELLAGKVRTSVNRVLMRPGDEVEVRSRNAVASVRGTDFVVQTVAAPARPSLGLLDVPGSTTRQRLGHPTETMVHTLSGVVQVASRLPTPHRLEQIGARETVRVSVEHDPARVRFSPGDLKQILEGLTLPGPDPTRTP